MRILITVEYNGKNYSGWQIQPNQKSVQGELTAALERLLNAKITLIASGRTDSGVHAKAQKAHFDFDGTFPVDRIPYATNTFLPDDIRIFEAKTVSDDFHAQYGAKKKTYEYRFYLSKINHPLLDEFAAHVPYSISDFDFDKANSATKQLVGTHDFLGFSSTGRPVVDSNRTIYDASLSQNGETVTLTVCGNGFLYNMVRIIAGTIAEIGLGLIPETAVSDVFRDKDRKKAGKTYPPQGLTLISVDYD